MNIGNKFSNGIKKIHFVGIKGVGMTPLAIIAKEAGFEVSGCDVSEVFITDKQLEKAGIKPLVGFSKTHVENVDLVIATGAHGGSENIEVKTAVEKGISILNQGDALGLFQDGEILGKKYFGISVAGSHGKTTTTAMVATILSENDLDPSFVIGTGEIPSLGSSGHFGRGKYFVAEADEYVADAVSNRVPKFLFQNPSIILITNIDFDHPDVYDSMEEIEKVFLQFANKLPPEGVLVACGDGKENRSFLSKFEGTRITYGTSPENDFYLEKVNFSPEKMFFWIKAKGASIGEFSINIFGEQNAINATGAIAVCLELGLTVNQIRKGLSVFKGTKRRSELVGTLPSGAVLYDDYAHHPEEVKKTLQAFRKSFPKEKIIVIFQPHMYSRTKKLFKEFSSSFSDANEVIFTEIFPSFREEIDRNFSSILLAEEINKFGKKAIYFPTLPDVVKYVTSKNYDRHTVVITMGAGDVYRIGNELIHPVR